MAASAAMATAAMAAAPHVWHSGGPSTTLADVWSHQSYAWPLHPASHHESGLNFWTCGTPAVVPRSPRFFCHSDYRQRIKKSCLVDFLWARMKTPPGLRSCVSFPSAPRYPSRTPREKPRPVQQSGLLGFCFAMGLVVGVPKRPATPTRKTNVHPPPVACCSSRATRQKKRSDKPVA
jgi:hypothetical protein